MKAKKIIILLALASISASAFAWTKVEASDLTVCGKAFDTPNPYHRVDTCVFKGFSRSENGQCRLPAGLTVLFKTDAERIGVALEFGNEVSRGEFSSYRGVDLYIRKDGKWLWAGMTSFNWDHKDWGRVHNVVTDMAPGEKEWWKRHLAEKRSRWRHG